MRFLLAAGKNRLGNLAWRCAAAALAAAVAAAAHADWDRNFADALTGFMHAEHGHPQRAAPLLLKAARATGQTALFAQAAEQALLANDLTLVSAISNEWHEAGGGIDALRLYGSTIIRRRGYPSAASVLARIASEGGPREAYLTVASALPRDRDRGIAARAAAAMAAAHPPELRNAEFWSHMVLLLTYGGDIPGAQEAAQRALAAGVADPVALVAALWAAEARPAADAERIRLAHRLAAALDRDLGDALIAYIRWSESFKESYAAIPADFSIMHPAQRGEARLRAATFLLANGEAASALAELGEADFSSQLIDYEISLRVEALGELGREADIGSLLEAALAALPPESIMPVARLAVRRVDERLGHKAAFEYLMDVRTQTPVNALVELQALYAERADRLDVAERLLRDLILRTPDDASPLNALGYLFADNNVNLEEADRLLQRALELDPQNPAIIDSYGWLLFRVGSLTEALEVLQQSIAVFEQQGTAAPGEVVAHVGEVYWALGQRARAIAVWRRGIEQTPDDEVLLETIRRHDAFGI